jgi:lipid-A-disaccharide synthase
MMARLTSGGRVVGVLPGSRTKEVTRNFPVMLRVIEELNARHFDLRIAVACYRPAHQELCRTFLGPEHEHLPLELYLGRTSEIVEAAECCLMVSGSVSLELLARSTPGVVMYRGTWMMCVLGHLLIRCRYMTLVNLLADRELMPEFPFVIQNSRCVGEMTRRLDEWLSAESKRQSVIEELSALRLDVAQPGGITRAAAEILAPLNAPAQKQAA